MSANPIGIVDSGVGGLSVFLEIKKALPKENIIYVGDQAFHPYSRKSKSVLEKRVGKLTEFLISRKIKVLVVACNTASCQVLPHLRSRFTLPIVGVIPAVKPASKIPNVSKIAILATGKTAKSDYLNNLVMKYAQSKRILKMNCNGLQEAIEDLDKARIADLLATYAKRIKKFKADAVVLACTHYSLLKDDIARMLNIAVIEPSPAIAKRVTSLIKLSNNEENETKYFYFSTGNPNKFSKTASDLLGFKIISEKANI